MYILCVVCCQIEVSATGWSRKRMCVLKPCCETVKTNIQGQLLPTIYVTSWSIRKFTIGSKVQPYFMKRRTQSSGNIISPIIVKSTSTSLYRNIYLYINSFILMLFVYLAGTYIFYCRVWCLSSKPLTIRTAIHTNVGLETKDKVQIAEDRWLQSKTSKSHLIAVL